jgi:hypothetical protein
VPHSSPEGPSGPLTIAIIGFGNFGQFLASRFVKAGHTIHATDFLIDHTTAAGAMGVGYVHADPIALLSLPIDVVIIAVSVLCFESVFQDKIVREARHLLTGRLIVDVLSVKTHPRERTIEALNPHCTEPCTRPSEAIDILCTHPMFGPESGGGSWVGLPFMYEKVRVIDHQRASRFLSLFEDEGCKMLPMSSERHDQLAEEALPAGQRLTTYDEGGGSHAALRFRVGRYHCSHSRCMHLLSAMHSHCVRFVACHARRCHCAVLEYSHGRIGSVLEYSAAAQAVCLNVCLNTAPWLCG